MKTLTIFLMIILSFSCKKMDNEDKVKNLSLQAKNEKQQLLKKNDTLVANEHEWDTLSIESVKFNQKKLFFPIVDLNLKKIDSTRYDLWVCGSPFEWMDEKKPTDSIIDMYCEGTRYSSNNSKVLVTSSFMKNNELTIHKDIKINEFTTINDFEKVFPLSYRKFIEAKKINPENYVKYDYMEVVFFVEQPGDHWIFYFDKKGYLIKFELYWWLC